MASRLFGTEPLTEPMVTKINNAIWRLNELGSTYRDAS